MTYTLIQQYTNGPKNPSQKQTRSEMDNKIKKQLRHLGGSLGKGPLGRGLRALTRDGVCDDVLVEDLNLTVSRGGVRATSHTLLCVPRCHGCGRDKVQEGNIMHCVVGKGRREVG